MGEWLCYNFVAGSFHTMKLCSRLYLIEIEFYSKKTKKSLFERFFGGLSGNVRTPSIARWKARVDLLFLIIELFRRLRRYKWKTVEVCVFRRRMGHFERKFQTEGRVADQPPLMSEN